MMGLSAANRKLMNEICNKTLFTEYRLDYLKRNIFVFDKDVLRSEYDEIEKELSQTVLGAKWKNVNILPSFIPFQMPADFIPRKVIEVSFSEGNSPECTDSYQQYLQALLLQLKANRKAILNNV
jgi:hypothetical protein